MQQNLGEKYLRRLHWFFQFLLGAFVLSSIWVFIAYFIPRLLPEATIINTSHYGIIFRNEKWQGEVRVVGDIWALPGAVVSIAPGTKIVVDDRGDKFNLNWLPWQLKSGLNTDAGKYGVRNGELFWDERHKIQINLSKVFAVGTKEQPINIQYGDGHTDNPFGLNVLSVNEGVLDHMRMADYRKLSLGDNVTLRDSELKNAGECAVCAEYTRPTIVNNVFEKARRQYIWVLGGDPKINDNLFLGTKSDGIVVDPQRFGAPNIYHNSFEMSGAALKFVSGGEEKGGVVSLNDFAGGSVIIIPCDIKTTFIQNQIRGVVRFSDSGSCVGSLSMQSNYWFSQDKEAILREKIVNKEATFEVIVSPALSIPPQDIGRRSDQ